MKGSAVSALVAVSLLETLSGCSFGGSSIALRPALTIDGKSLIGDTAQQYETGKRLLAQGRFAAAAQSFQAVILAGGPSVEVLNALAITYDDLGRFDLSAEIYRRALVIDARNMQTLNNYGLSLARQGMPDKARLVLAQAESEAPDNQTVASNLTRVQVLLQSDRGAKQATGTPLQTLADLYSPPEPAQIPRIEHVAVGVMQLISSESQIPGRAKTVSQAAIPSRSVAQVKIEEKSSAATANLASMKTASEPAAGKGSLVTGGTDPTTNHKSFKLEVANGAGRNHMAARMRSFFQDHAIPVSWLTNDKNFDHERTVITYRPGFHEDARKLAQLLLNPVVIYEDSTMRADVRLCVGRDLINFDLTLKTIGVRHEA